MRDDGAPSAEAAARAREIAAGAAFTEAEIDTLNLVPDELRGLDRLIARKRVVAQITDEGLAVMVAGEIDDSDGRICFATDMVPFVEAKPITQPFGDRSHVVIEPMLTDQWFLDAGTLAKPALAAVREGRTRIVPESHQNTYFRWLENIEPWCISRQLWWGHQIPVWYGPAVNSEGDLARDFSWRFCSTSEEGAVDEAELEYRMKTRASWEVRVVANAGEAIALMEEVKKNR
jgi:valyl-tRNA synthetase